MPTFQAHLHAVRTGEINVDHRHERTALDPHPRIPATPPPIELHPQFVAKDESAARARLATWLETTGYTPVDGTTTIERLAE